jgi:hypothetical protein
VPGGVSLAPVGIFLKTGNVDLPSVAHECFHFEQAMHWLGGPYVWYAAYGLEFGVRFSFLYNIGKAYRALSFERGAVDWAIQRSCN